MPKTAKSHFDKDIRRAQNLADHAQARVAIYDGEVLFKDDLFRSAWMFAVGAMDAYFCDAYGDLVARTLRAKAHQPNVDLQPHILKIELPVDTVLTAYDERENWRWRMAARKMIENDNVLSLDAVRKLFNPFCREEHRLATPKTIDAWIGSAGQAAKRVFGVDPVAYTALTGSAKNDARKAAKEHMEERFKSIIQRRHDCIHNCDRPRVKPQRQPAPAGVRLVIRDVAFLVQQCDQHFDREFRLYLKKPMGCDPITANKVLTGF